MTLRKPITGEAAAEIKVWFTSKGSSPITPYVERTRLERRYVKVPGHLIADTTEDQWCIESEAGETPEP
ncbi:hypothetical protein [Synechococcus sp. SYN20]|uniref:hypothetical protein n=1 Tax=Synechococcus sp. SYN20 TaxID=1050714 RepID=UPI00164574AC|nr:hypothetical protein [Synechococcus sp. SYN20]